MTATNQQQNTPNPQPLSENMSSSAQTTKPCVTKKVVHMTEILVSQHAKAARARSFILRSGREGVSQFTGHGAHQI